MTNAETAQQLDRGRAWQVSAVGKHFVAVSTALDKVADVRHRPGPRVRLLGLGRRPLFALGRHRPADHDRGRRPRTSAISSPVPMPWTIISSTPLDRNLPVLLALVGIWNRNVFWPGQGGAGLRPAAFAVRGLSAAARHGIERQARDARRISVSTSTGPLVWGEPGTNGQHAFFQLLHQGTDLIPVEVLAAAHAHEPELKHHHDLVLATAGADAALIKGRTMDEARTQLLVEGRHGPTDIDALAPHSAFPGNRPRRRSLPVARPVNGGSPYSLYEHHVFVEAQIFGIDSPSTNGAWNWARTCHRTVADDGRQSAPEGDASTAGLVRRIHGLARRSS